MFRGICNVRHIRHQGHQRGADSSNAHASFDFKKSEHKLKIMKQIETLTKEGNFNLPLVSAGWE